MQPKFGDRIKELRLERKLGLRQFAKKVDISATYMSRLERGLDPPPSVEVILEMAGVLRVAPEPLLVLAKTTPPVWKEAFLKHSHLATKVAEFMRTVKETKLSEEDWDRLIKEVKDMGGKK